MSIEEITIKQVKQSFGFAKPVETTLAGAVFDNGKIAYLDTEKEVCVAYDEKSMVSSLKQEKGCIEVQVIRKYKG